VSVGCLGVVLFLAPSFILLLECVVAWLRRYLSRGCSSLVSTISWFEASSLSRRGCACGIQSERMGDDPVDRDARIVFSIGVKQEGDAEDLFIDLLGLVLDHHRGLLFVVDSHFHRVQVLSYDGDDGFSFVSKFGEEGSQPGQLKYPWDVAIDHDHDRILIVDQLNDRVQSWSLSEQSFISCIGQHGTGDLEFYYPRGIAIDKHHRRIIIVDSDNHRLVFLSIDFSFLFSVGKKGSRPGELYFPSNIAIDDDRHRIIVTDTENHRVQVLSSIDGSFLFEFGSKGGDPNKFMYPHSVCIANQGRIIVADSGNNRLQAFTHDGHHISSFECGNQPSGVAFDEHRGLIVFSASNQLNVIGANQWLPDTFTWRVDRHRHAPPWIKQAVSTMTMIRSLVDESALSMIPNEILFEIFSFL